MAKYPEGSISPGGKYIVRGGEWVAREDTRTTSEKTAETLHTDERGRALSFPHQPAARPEVGVMAATLPFGGPALKVAGKALSLAATPGGGAVIGAAEGLDEGPMGVVEGAAKGAAGGYIAGVPGKLLQFLTRFKKAETAAKAVRMAAATAKGEERAANTLKTIGIRTKEEIDAMRASGTLPIPPGFRRPRPGDITDVLPSQAAGAATAAAPTQAAVEAKRITDMLVRMKFENKFSDGQIIDTLKQEGYSASVTRAMLKALGGQ